MKTPPWKYYTKATIESLVAFYLATFSLAVFFTHQGVDFILLAVLQVVLYLFIVGVIVRRVIQKFPVQALMLMVPMVPLIVLIIVITMIPVLERLQ